MNHTIQAIKRTDMLLMSAIRNLNKGDHRAALVDMQAALTQLSAAIDIIPKQ